MKRLLVTLSLLFLLDSCFDQNDCLITSTNLVKIDFETVAGVSQNVTLIRVRQDSLGVNRTDTVGFPIYESQAAPFGQSSIALPVNPEHDTSYYSFETSDSVKYRLALRYTTFSRVISTDCGAFLYYKDLAVVPMPNGFTNTKVVESQLFKSVTTNIKILF